MSNTPAKSKNYPALKMYRVIPGRTKEDKSIWTEVAALWEHKDRGGFSVKLKDNETLQPGAQYVIRREKQQDASFVAKPV